MAVPMTSARSAAQMAISHNTHCASAERRELWWRHACARSMPQTRPSRLASTCNSTAMQLDMAMTHSRR